MSDEFISADDDHDMFDPQDVARKRGEQAREIADETDETRRMLLHRREAYARVFKGGATGDDVKVVVEDLKRFCRGETTTFNADQRVHALLTGRQEVYLRIMDHVRLSFDDLYTKYTTPQGD